ncbi:probable LRR receptor-like serine/threonine-protein kinase At5g63710 isoform X2 [Phaseolus vulgaris]|uniref:probable LRR receptor-like serine/threonine-protein kinase At5g63710 isoform X2 n=1 Tax=Phaseolus vulgaris TaxID=3885 RepID=UPI0035CAFFEB
MCLSVCDSRTVPGDEHENKFVFRGLSSTSLWGLLKILTRWLIFLSILTVSSAIKDPDVEGEALLDLLHFLNDSNKQITDWDSHLVSPCFSWSHVTCRNGHVISLALASVGFVGTLSLSITKLKYLVSVKLQNNNLSGPLPDYISYLKDLQYLNLADNNFNGSISDKWDELSNLS